MVVATDTVADGSESTSEFKATSQMKLVDVLAIEVLPRRSIIGCVLPLRRIASPPFLVRDIAFYPFDDVRTSDQGRSMFRMSYSTPSFPYPSPKMCWGKSNTGFQWTPSVERSNLPGQSEPT